MVNKFQKIKQISKGKQILNDKQMSKGKQILKTIKFQNSNQSFKR